MVIKLHLLLSVLLFPALALATTIGVIRWDCICDPTSPELKSLSPLKWHYRVPDFLTIAADNSVTGTENDQAVIDQQITYAKNAGIDYWAFITQPTTNPDADEFYALDKYLSSSRKADVKFCIILHKYNSDWAGRVTQLVNWFKEASYVKVLGNRPLVYFYSLTDMETQYGDQTQNCIDQLRSQTTAAGLGSPYLVPMNGSGYGTDARSAYCFWNAGGDGTYAPHAAANAATWDSWITWGGSQVDWLRIIPLVSAGINDGPRVDNPPPWGGGNSPKVDYPTPYQLAMHIKRGLDYVASHPGNCETDMVLVYAWNEYCEGGWLNPTHSEGPARLDAIRAMLDGTLPVTTTVNDNTTGTGTNQFEYTGSWTYSNAGTALDSRYRQDDHYSTTANSHFQVRFNAAQIRWYGAKAPGFGTAAVSIDGGAETNINCAQPIRNENLLLYDSGVLAAGPHTLKVRVVSGTVAVDRVDILAAAPAGNTVAAPVLNPNGAIFNDSVNVTLTCATAGAEIRYTLDGTDPTQNSTVYTLPITITSTSTIKARGFKSGMTASSTVTAVFTKNALGPNLALNKPVTVSSTEDSYSAGNAVDGDAVTRWGSEYSDPQWIQIDLENTYTLETVVLNWEVAYGLNYRIEVSANGTEWTTAYTQTEGTGGTETIALNATGRYIWLYGTARGTQWGYSLYEFEVYGTSNTVLTDRALRHESTNADPDIYPNPLTRDALRRLAKQNGWQIYNPAGSPAAISRIAVNGIFLLGQNGRATKIIMVSQ